MKSDKKQSQAVSIFADEKGSVMVLSLLILVIASIIGVISVNTSTIEIQVASLDRVEKETFYQAEGAAMEAAQLLENETAANLKSKSEDWLNDDTIDFSTDNWGVNKADSTLVGNDYTIADTGVAHGSSLDMSNETQLHHFRVYGRNTYQGKEKIVEIEYRRRF